MVGMNRVHQRSLWISLKSFAVKAELGVKFVKESNQRNKKQPIAKAEDVEFSMELADEADVEALERMRAADQRAQSRKQP
jgi:hypothetical protein